MNERIRELAERAGLEFDDDLALESEPIYYIKQSDFEKFAESIIQDCLNMCDWQTGQRIQAHFEYRDNRWPETELNPKPF